MPVRMWDLPGPGIEPMSPALAGGFLTTGPPGKSHQQIRPENTSSLFPLPHLSHPCWGNWFDKDGRATERLSWPGLSSGPTVLPQKWRSGSLPMSKIWNKRKAKAQTTSTLPEGPGLRPIEPLDPAANSY